MQHTQAMTIRELPNEEIGKRLQAFCELCDIAPPQDGGALIQFIKTNFGNLRNETLSRAFNYWASVDSDLQRPRKLNGHFVAGVFRLFLEQKRAQNKNDAYKNAVIAKPDVVQSPEQRKNELLAAIDILLLRYDLVFRQGQTNTYMIVGAMESLHAEALEFGLYSVDDFDHQELKEKEQAIRDYVFRTQLGINRQKPTWMLNQDVSVPQTTYFNSAMMALYFDTLIFERSL